MPDSRRSSLGSLLAAVVVLLAACQSAPAPSSEPAPATPASTPPTEVAARGTDAEPSTLDGIYTEAQAQRGAQVFEDTCAACHAAEDWQDELFLARWEGESVYRFWYWMYESMPDDEPPYSLPREQVSDVLTYILQLNGLPAGDAELGSDDDSIDQHWLRWGKPSN